MLLLKSEVLDARVRDWPASLVFPITARFLFEPEDDVLGESSVIDPGARGIGRRMACGGGGEIVWCRRCDDVDGDMDGDIDGARRAWLGGSINCNFRILYLIVDSRCQC